MVLGWMSTRVLGQYDLLVIEDEDPDDQDLVYYVGPNVLALEKQFAFPPEQFRLWLALHEVTHRAQFTGVPWLRPHFLGLVHQTLGAVDPDPKRLIDGVNRMAEAIRSGPQPAGRRRHREPGRRARAAGRARPGQRHDEPARGPRRRHHGPRRRGPGAQRRALRAGAAPAARVGQGPGPAGPAADRPRGQARASTRRARRSSPPSSGPAGPTCSARAWEAPGNLPSLIEIREPHRWIERMGAALPAAG